jgi:hypothetical protein
MKKIRILLIILLLIYIGYIYFSEPRMLVVADTGKVEGTNNKARALIQGKKFWKHQLVIAASMYNESLVPHPPSSTELKELYQNLRTAQRKLDERMQSLYTFEERIAISLRTQADSLDRASKWRALDEADEKERLMETEKIRTIVQIIETRLKIDKEQSVAK